MIEAQDNGAAEKAGDQGEYRHDKQRNSAAPRGSVPIRTATSCAHSAVPATRSGGPVPFCGEDWDGLED
jgi:hypothetical protein